MAKGEMSKWTTKDGLILLQGWARSGLTDEQIAHNMGIHVSTLYKYKDRSDEINDALKKTKEVVDYEVECALLENAMKGNVTAQIFWLKNRKKNEWREKIELPTNPQELNKVQELLTKLTEEAYNDIKR